MAFLEAHDDPDAASRLPEEPVTAESVTKRLRAEILAGEFTPGQRLGQELLATRFKTSRMPVRTALRQLEAEGLVTTVAHSGAWVSKLDRFEFEQVYKMREALEPLAITASLPHLNTEQIDEIVAVAGQLRKATLPQVKIEDFLRLDRKFHLLTYAGVQYEPLRL